MNTPIYDALVLHYGWTGGEWKSADGSSDMVIKILSIEVLKPKAEPAWKTFFRCLLWWMP
jgi:hypothetical protein